MSGKKRSVWAFIGKVLWTIISLLLRGIAALGSRWASKKLDEHRERNKAGRVSRALHPNRH